LIRTVTLKISVITVVRNGAATIEEAILSVLTQRHGAVEYVVIDGASTDSTLAIIDRYRNRIATLISEPDRGIYDAMNKGIRAAKGDIIGFLNADDAYVSDDVLQQVAKTFENPENDACFADLVYVAKNDPRKIIRYWKSRPYEAGAFKRGWMIAHPTFFVRRSVYERLGGFDLDYRIQADFELAMRFLEIHRIRSVYVPQVWVRFRAGGESNKHVMNVIRGNIEAYRACHKHGVKVTPFFMLRKILTRVPQFILRPKSL